jgi:hypothetical protein
MNVEIGTEAAQFTEKEYISGIFLAVCTPSTDSMARPDTPFHHPSADYSQRHSGNFVTF